jgi:hypothetical protein
MTTPEITPTTELEAVNAILYSIGESPVASLTEGFVDADLAQNILRRLSKMEQLKGWQFNTLWEYTLTPDGDGYLNLPQNFLKMIYRGERRYQPLGLKLYDNIDHTDVFTDTVNVDLVIGRNFDEIPEALRLYLFTSAARRFQDQMGSDSAVHRFSVEDELRAKADWMNYASDTELLNVRDLSSTVSRATGGRYR